ncbi:unnamed protein product [Owenia fusiformis]|uniref:DUF4211 domain-containing protein n=1 Tax=Owenia fusiformis TaxID=6347 RepID=A0A8J1TTG8_OWEFU|nr:unnamed protein product [Owenia fusiformis]
MVDPYWPPEAFIAHPTNSSSDIELELQDFTSLKSEHDQENGLPQQQQQQGILDELSVMPLSQPTVVFSTPPKNTHQQHDGLSGVTQERNALQEMYTNKNIGDTDSQNAVKSPSCCNRDIVVEKQDKEGQKTDNEESDSTVNYNNENPDSVDSNDSDSKIHHSAKKSSAKKSRVLNSESESDSDKSQQSATDEDTYNDTINESGSEYTPDSDTESEDAEGSDITEASASELPSVSESETSDDSKSSTCSSGSKYVPSPSTSKGQGKKQRELRSERVRSTSSSSSADDFKSSRSCSKRRQKGKPHKRNSSRRNSSSSESDFRTSKNKRRQSKKTSKRKRKDSGMDASFYRNFDNEQKHHQIEEEEELDEDQEFQQELADYKKSTNEEKLKYLIEKTLRQLLYSPEQFKNYVESLRYVKIVDPAIQHVMDKWIMPKAELVQSTAWRRNINEAASSLSVAIFDEYETIRMKCQCCGRKRMITKKAIFTGNKYNRDTLVTDDDELDEGVTREKKFKIGDDCRANLEAFHDIHHWLYHFKSRAVVKIDEVKAKFGDDVEVDEIITSILEDEDWIEEQTDDIREKLTTAECVKMNSKATYSSCTRGDFDDDYY